MTMQMLSKPEKEELKTIGNFYRNAIYSNTSVLATVTQFCEDLDTINGEISQTILSEILHFKTLIMSQDFFHIFKEWLNELNDILSESLPVTIFATQDCRRKGFESTVRKTIRNYLDCSSINLYDLIAFRVISDSLIPEDELNKSCYLIKKICNSFFKEKLCVLCTPNKKVGSDPLAKDYIEVPKEHGYQSIHLAYRTQANIFFEVQIRTLAMHDQAEVGTSAHIFYKDKVDKIVSQYIHFNPNKVHMPQFRVLANGTIYDKIGLKHALSIN